MQTMQVGGLEKCQRPPATLTTSLLPTMIEFFVFNICTKLYDGQEMAQYCNQIFVFVS